MILQLIQMFFPCFYNFVGINQTIFENIRFGKYNFGGSGGTITYKNNFGEIKFLDEVNGSGMNFSEDIQLLYNSAIVKPENNPGLQRSANVTLKELAGNFVDPAILKDNVKCPIEVCTNYTDLNSQTVVFKVTGWSDYTIGSLGCMGEEELEDYIDIYYSEL